MMEKTKIVIDGKNATLGRLSSYAAKQALNGNDVVIVNANEVIILGNKYNILEKFKIKIKKGGSSLKGPTIIRNPERVLKRTIRGMLPHKMGRGEDALKRIKCYNQVPAEYEGVKIEKFAKEEKHGKFITLKELVSLTK